MQWVVEYSPLGEVSYAGKPGTMASEPTRELVKIQIAVDSARRRWEKVKTPTCLGQWSIQISSLPKSVMLEFISIFTAQ